MKLAIKNTTSIAELNRQFRKKFPYLRLDLFLSEKKGKTISQLHVTDESTLLGSLRSGGDGELIIDGSDKVSEVEKKFRRDFGLSVQVMRLSGTTWLMTTATDGHTLDEVNQIGEEMVAAVPPAEPEDIHEQP